MVGKTSVFPGDSEMARRMRAFDWTQTPLGPPETWPHNLQTSVRILLMSRHPMFVWWGDQLINLYNDGYATFLHKRHPAALAQPAAKVWPEIWDEVGPRAESARRHEAVAHDEALPLVMLRKGYAEETYVTFSYCPIPDDDGGFGGILCPVTDETERIVGERQLALLQELASSTANARTAREVCALAAEALATDAADLPFAMIYLWDQNIRTATLAGCVGVAAGTDAAPNEIGPDGPSTWPVAKVFETERSHVVRQLSDIADRLPVVREAFRPVQAVVIPLPIAEPLARRAGVLVVGLNPLRRYDDRYGRFLDLVALAIAAAITNAQAFDAERRRAEALEQVDRAKTEFFSNVSHEFRTPLTLMLGPLEEELQENTASSRLKVVYRNALRMLKLVSTLLDFSRTEAGRIDAVYQPTDLAALTVDLTSVFRSAIESAGLRLRVDCPPLPEQVNVDRDMWENIVLNLLSNAFKFTFDGEIGVTLRASDGRAELIVSDTGVGIPASELPHVFERFRRVRETRSRTHEGSGIGLALVQQLVKLHGGEISVDSLSGRGSTFTVAVPFGAAHLPADRTMAQASRKDGSRRRWSAFVDEAELWLPDVRRKEEEESAKRTGPRATILVADDNADLRRYVGSLLKRDHDVVTASDGEAALEAIREHPPDLLIADVMMPGLDGHELVARLRADPATAYLPIILLSARVGEEARTQGLAHGADDYLIKPFGARELRARVRAHLDLASSRRAAEQALVTEVRERRAGEAQIKALFQRLVSVQEEERRRIAREIHDQLGQQMTALRMNLEAVRLRSEGDAERVAQAERTLQLAEALDRSIDFLTWQLRPAVLDHLGLPAALQNLVSDWSERFGIAAECDTHGLHGLRLAGDVEMNLYRLTQEALHNVLKHARASHVTVFAEQRDRQLVLVIGDDGRGFDPAETHERPGSGGLGLVNMRERANLIGATIQIDSAPGHGTAISVRVPIHGSLSQPCIVA